MALKVNIFYQSGTNGWTETYYIPSATDPIAWIAANGQSTTLKNFVSFRAPLTSIVAIRASQVGAPRVTYTRFTFGDPLLVGTAGIVSGGGPDTTGAAARMSMIAGAGQTRQLWIRGLRDIDISRDGNGNSVASANLTNGFNNMYNALAGWGFAIQNVVVPPNGGLVWYPVQTVAPDAANPTTQSFLATTTAPVGGLAAFPALYIRGIPTDNLPGLPTKISVTGVTATGTVGFTIPYAFRGKVNPQPVAKMKCCVLQYNYNTITKWEFEQFTTRKTGRPTFLSRGRARTKVGRQ